MKVKSESEVAQSCPTLSNPMDCSPPGSSVHGVFQARVLEWGAIAFSGTRLSETEQQQTLQERRKRDRERGEKSTQLFNRISLCSLSWQGASALYPGSPKSLENLLAHISENRFGIRVVPSLE